MEEFIAACVMVGLCYTILRFFKISWFKQGFPPSFIYLAGVFVWFTALGLIAVAISFVSMLIDAASAADADTIIPVVAVLIAVGILTKVLMDRKEILDIPHMMPLLRAAALFRPYDARRQEMLERNERYQLAQAKKAEQERIASGEPAEEVMDISEDAGANRESPQTKAEISQTPTELQMLKRGEGVDITELFKTNTAKLPAHPLYQYVSALRIDPSDHIMSFRLVLPPTATEPELTQEKLQRVKQGVYQVFQILLFESWLAPYLGFINALKVACVRVHKDEFDMMRETSFMSIQMDVAQIRRSKGKPFPGAEFDNIASVNVEG